MCNWYRELARSELRLDERTFFEEIGIIDTSGGTIRVLVDKVLVALEDPPYMLLVDDVDALLALLDSTYDEYIPLLRRYAFDRSCDGDVHGWAAYALICVTDGDERSSVVSALLQEPGLFFRSNIKYFCDALKQVRG